MQQSTPSNSSTHGCLLLQLGRFLYGLLASSNRIAGKLQHVMVGALARSSTKARPSVKEKTPVFVKAGSVQNRMHLSSSLACGGQRSKLAHGVAGSHLGTNASHASLAPRPQAVLLGDLPGSCRPEGSCHDGRGKRENLLSRTENIWRGTFGFSSRSLRCAANPPTNRAGCALVRSS